MTVGNLGLHGCVLWWFLQCACWSHLLFPCDMLRWWVEDCSRYAYSLYLALGYSLMINFSRGHNNICHILLWSLKIYFLYNHWNLILMQIGFMYPLQIQIDFSNNMLLSPKLYMSWDLISSTWIKIKIHWVLSWIKFSGWWNKSKWVTS